MGNPLMGSPLRNNSTQPETTQSKSSQRDVMQPNSKPKNLARQKVGWVPLWAIGLVLALTLGGGLASAFSPAFSLLAQTEEAAEDADATPASPGRTYLYTVRSGDSWGTVSERTGVSVAELQAANPDKVRDTEWLLDGEQLHVPIRTGSAQREHIVEVGESWSSIAARYNVPVALLQAANPRSIRSGMLLYRGERLVIPPAPTATEIPDDADAEDVDAVDPDDADDAALDDAAEEGLAEEDATPEVTATITESETVTVEVPTAPATPEPTEEATVEPTEEPAAEPTQEPVAEPTEDEIDETDEAADDATRTPTISAEIPACPERFLDYPQALTAAINADPEDGPAGLQAFLAACEALTEDGLIVQDLTGNDIDDVIVVYFDPTGESLFIDSDLAIFNGEEDGYTLSYRARAAGDVRLLTVDDINVDGQVDVVWVDTTCGASTCFDTVNIRSWTGEAWSDWTEGTITMAYADIELIAVDELDSAILDMLDLEIAASLEEMDITIPVATDEDDEATAADTATETEADELAESDLDEPQAEDAQTEDDALEETGAEAESSTIAGQAIVLQGGIYGSIGAGPQRNRVEVWASVDGAPYSLIDQQYMPSECLYYTVIDANEAFLDGWADDFERAESLYIEALTDSDLISCWVRPNEEDELRSFSLFRLALIAGYRDDASTAAEYAEAVLEEYPDEIYEAVASIWLREYQSLGNAAEACGVVTQFAELTPETWEILADYGYTNPTFEADDVCPILWPPDPEDNGQDNGAPDNGAPDNDTEIDDADAEETALDSTALDSTEMEEVAGAPEGVLASFPECPADLSGYAAALVGVLNTADGDEDLIEAWMTSCRALTETRGAFVLTDITGNGQDDAIFFPVLVTDLGFGPGGAQGTTLIYHSVHDPDAENGTASEYTLVANPEIYGMPEPLTIGDLRGDGNIEVAWTVTGCSTFCVTEVQMWSWDGEAYTPAILPGATMANAEVSFEPVAPDDETAGQRLILYGGVSGTPDGGLETPHWEEWQSINGEPFQRVYWEYDRSVAGSECLGLRLVEADVALQAAQAIGYELALELYANALADLAADELEACSLMGMDAETELDLLEGLATFRLIQAYALDGSIDEAAALVADFEAEGADTDYVTAARTWWDGFSAELDAEDTVDVAGAAQAACGEVLPLFDANPELWQVTDQYGYNHPVLAAEQICFVP